MQRSTRYKALLIGTPVAAAILVGGIALAATQPSTQPESPPSASSGPIEEQTDARNGIDANDITEEEAMALDAAEIMTTWQAAEDFNQTVAEQRATHLMTDERAEAITLPDRPASGSEWREAAEREATSQPHAELMPYTEGDSIAVHVTWRWTSPEHNPLSGGERRFYFTFTEDDQGEPLIHDYTWEDG